MTSKIPGLQTQISIISNELGELRLAAQNLKQPPAEHQQPKGNLASELLAAVNSEKDAAADEAAAAKWEAKLKAETGQAIQEREALLKQLEKQLKEAMEAEAQAKAEILEAAKNFNLAQEQLRRSFQVLRDASFAGKTGGLSVRVPGALETRAWPKIEVTAVTIFVGEAKEYFNMKPRHGA